MDWSLSPPGPIRRAAIDEMRQILENYAQKGVPDDLVEAAKRSEIASAEFNRNSIPGLADVWSDALAAEGRNSPDDDLDAIKRVTLADVNRVAKKYLLSANSITAILKPVPTRSSGRGQGLWRTGTGNPGSQQAGRAARLGEGGARATEGADPATRGFRYDFAEWPAPDREDRPYQPDHIRSRIGQEQLRSADPEGAGRGFRFAGRPFLLRHDRPSTGWPSRRRSTTSRPTSRRATIFQ